MKRFLFTIACCAIASMANAQLKIHSNGYISLHNSQNPISPISINCNGRSGNYMTYFGNNNGLFFCSRDGIDDYGWSIATYSANDIQNPSTYFYVGARGSAQPGVNAGPQTGGRAYGVMGIAANMSAGYNYGVFGKLAGTANGAGIFGTVSAESNGVGVPGRYAGYFDGNTHVQGDLTVSGSINGIYLSVAMPSQTRQGIGEDYTSYTDRLSELVTHTYQLPSSSRQRSAVRSDTTEAVITPDVITLQAESRMHYGLSTSQLEETFPELVYEKEDGSKAVNYMEMIPLLVQTIGELNSRIAELEGGNPAARRTSSNSATTSADASSINPAAGKLLQNTPNPFTERTTIRFTLPDNAVNAYIYIFDMSGKMVKQLPVDTSMQSITINGYELSAGMYIYSLIVDGKEIDTKRMILSK